MSIISSILRGSVIFKPWPGPFLYSEGTSDHLEPSTPNSSLMEPLPIEVLFMPVHKYNGTAITSHGVDHEQRKKVGEKVPT
jgi:hypothetical protein